MQGLILQFVEAWVVRILKLTLCVQKQFVFTTYLLWWYRFIIHSSFNFVYFIISVSLYLLIYLIDFEFFSHMMFILRQISHVYLPRSSVHSFGAFSLLDKNIDLLVTNCGIICERIFWVPVLVSEGIFWRLL